MTKKMTNAEAAVAWDRSEGFCEIGVSAECRGEPEQLHHRLPRGMGGTSNPDVHSPDRLLATCAACHAYVESHLAVARVAGWHVPMTSDPAVVPVLYRDRGRVLLGVDGSVSDWMPDEYDARDTA